MNKFNRPSLNTPEKLANLTTDELEALERLARSHCERQRDGFGDEAYEAAVHFSGLNDMTRELMRRKSEGSPRKYHVEIVARIVTSYDVTACSEGEAIAFASDELAQDVGVVLDVDAEAHPQES